jgi:hypothetical protein
VAIFLRSPSEELLLLRKLEDALVLIREHAPTRYRTVRNAFSSILICGTEPNLAWFDVGLRLCQLSGAHLLRDDVSPAIVASSVVHESEHARLIRLGIPYTPDTSDRVERVCFRAERAFGRRLPDGAEVVTHATAGMELPDGFYKPEATAMRQWAVMKELPLPRLVLQPLLWIFTRRVRSRLGRRAPWEGRPTTR